MSPEYDLSDPDAVAFCPSCGAGYTARVTRCASCDVPLVPRAEAERAAREAAPEPESDAGFDVNEAESSVLLCRLEDPVKGAQLAEDLDQAGVPYWRRSARWESLGGTPPFVEFRVPARYLDEAQRVLQGLEA